MFRMPDAKIKGKYFSAKVAAFARIFYSVLEVFRASPASFEIPNALWTKRAITAERLQ